MNIVNLIKNKKLLKEYEDNIKSKCEHYFSKNISSKKKLLTDFLKNEFN